MLTWGLIKPFSNGNSLKNSISRQQRTAAKSSYTYAVNFQRPTINGNFYRGDPIRACIIATCATENSRSIHAKREEARRTRTQGRASGDVKIYARRDSDTWGRLFALRPSSDIRYFVPRGLPLIYTLINKSASLREEWGNFIFARSRDPPNGFNYYFFWFCSAVDMSLGSSGKRHGLLALIIESFIVNLCNVRGNLRVSM